MVIALQSPSVNHHLSIMMQLMMKYIHLNSPTISLINTYFNNPNNNNNIYELYGTPTWKTCSEEPFIYAVNGRTGEPI